MAQVLKDIFSTQIPRPKRVVIVGTRGSAKTTFLGSLALACDLLSQREKGFKHFIDERTSGICQVPSDLCAGFFPEPTPPGLIYEADMYLTWQSLFGEKTICLPFCETSGEDIENLIGPYKQSQYHQAIDYQDAQNLTRYICDSNGYILVAPVNRPHVPGVPKEFLDEEPTSLRWDPDVNLRRILGAIYHYKKQTRSPPIEGIAVLLTKYDTIDTYLKSQGMDLYDPIGARIFLQTYFRQTTGLLKYYGLEKVKFFPFHVQVEKIKHPDGTISFNKWSEGRGYKITLDEKRNIPKFAEQSCYDVINWIKETFIK